MTKDEITNAATKVTALLMGECYDEKEGSNGLDLANVCALTVANVAISAAGDENMLEAIDSICETAKKYADRVPDNREIPITKP